SALIMPEWVELFERHRVRAVFAGHDHAYERMERNGVRYFVSGGGGAPLYAERVSCASFDRAAKRIFRSQYHLLRVRGDRHSAQATALPIDEAGPPLDQVRFTAGEQTFATDAPRLAEDGGSRRPWLLGGLGAMVLVGLFARRRRR